MFKLRTVRHWFSPRYQKQQQNKKYLHPMLHRIAVHDTSRKNTSNRSTNKTLHYVGGCHYGHVTYNVLQEHGINSAVFLERTVDYWVMLRAEIRQKRSKH